MEFLLLWVDDLDDALCALRHLAPKILGFAFAVALFAATGYALLSAPHLAFAALLVAVPASLIEVARRRLRSVARRDRR
jgi:hypothetical protein